MPADRMTAGLYSLWPMGRTVDAAAGAAVVTVCHTLNCAYVCVTVALLSIVHCNIFDITYCHVQIPK